MIEDIEMRYIRSYEHAKIDLSSGINLFYGDNGVGKTTLLEAVYTLSTTKSFRTGQLTEMIQKNQEAGKMTLNTNREKLAIEIRPRQKKYFIDENTIQKQSVFFGQFWTIVLAPEHLLIVEGSKQQRQAFVDQIISTIDPSYINTLKDFQKILKQKRALIKQGLPMSLYQEQAQVWEQQNQKVSQEIRHKRMELIEQLKPIFIQTYQDVAHQKTNIDLNYQPKQGQEENNLETKVTQEYYAKRVLFGAHRDDINIQHDDMEAKKTASHGEKATLVLGLKFAELELLQKHGKEQPIFLLDDIGTTLDQTRRQKLFEKLQDLGCQSIISTCDPYIHQEIVSKHQNIKDFTFDNQTQNWT